MAARRWTDFITDQTHLEMARSLQSLPQYLAVPGRVLEHVIAHLEEMEAEAVPLWDDDGQPVNEPALAAEDVERRLQVLEAKTPYHFASEEGFTEYGTFLRDVVDIALKTKDFSAKIEHGVCKYEVVGSLWVHRAPNGEHTLTIKWRA